ncbi:hypothetical protein B0H14DRAFT_2805091 [Mycena olivaceomarginata]|nr:hypothetical protein B0H14DRAFT_2805091 [Mycena olivaceomarginata]
MATTATPAFPEDIERAISEVLLEDTREMCSTMSLVALRFHTWTKPVRFRTVVVHRHENWMKRVENLFFPNAHYIRVLAVNLPLSGGVLSAEEFSCMRTLLEASQGVRHLAIVWHLWTPFARLCGSRPLESLYFIWDRSWKHRNPVLPPSLEYLQYPSALADLTIYAPADLYNPTPFTKSSSRPPHTARISHTWRTLRTVHPFPLLVLCARIPASRPSCSFSSTFERNS